MHGCPIWSPNLSNTHWQDLQNAALRTDTGCVKMSKVDHLHTEAKIMPVQQHNEMLLKQFLLATQQADHPKHCDLDAAPPDREPAPEIHQSERDLPPKNRTTLAQL